MKAIERLLAPLKRQIYLLLGRAILAYVNNSPKTQTVHLDLLADETASNVERFQEYGFETYPFTNAEALGAFLNGNRAHGIVICVHDRRYRPQYLVEGETVLYTDEDQNSPYHRIHFKRNNEIEMKCETMDQDINGNNTVDVGGNRTETISGNKTQTITNIYLVTAPSIALNGSAVVLGGPVGAGKTLATDDIISLFNNHKHAGGAVPDTLMDSSYMTSNTKAV